MALVWICFIVLSTSVCEFSYAEPTAVEAKDGHSSIGSNPSYASEEQEETLAIRTMWEHLELVCRRNRMIRRNRKGMMMTPRCMLLEVLAKDEADINANVPCPHIFPPTEDELENYCECPPLYLAAKIGDLEMAKYILGRGADINATCDGVPLICMAYNNLDMMTLLIENGADLSLTLKDGRTLLHLMIMNELKSTRHDRRGEIFDEYESEVDSTIKYLIRKGMEINARNHAGDTPLMIVASTMQYATCRSCQHNFSLDDDELLRCPTEMKHLAQILLKNGADVSARNMKNFTALHLATWQCHCRLAETMLEAGADVNTRTGDGKTPLHTAIARTKLNTGDKRKKGTEVQCLELSRMLIGAGADINAKMEDDWTPLHLAVYYADFKSAKMLVDEGAALDVKDNLGCTPLHLAVMASNNIDVLLILSGANVNIKQSNGWTPLHLAVFYQKMDAAELLLRNGAEVDAKQNGGWTPWMMANEMDQIEMAKMLAEYGGIYSLIHSAVQGWWESIISFWEQGSKTQVDEEREFPRFTTLQDLHNWARSHDQAYHFTSAELYDEYGYISYEKGGGTLEEIDGNGRNAFDLRDLRKCKSRYSELFDNTII